MNADEFPKLLRELTIEGATVGPVLSDRGEPAGPGSGLESGFTVTGQHGARMAWQVALQREGVQPGVSSPVFPAAVPAEPDKLVAADVEASIAAWIGQSSAREHVTDIDLYSANPSVTGSRYGVKVTLASGGRVFIQLLWTLRPDEKFERDNKYRILDVI